MIQMNKTPHFPTQLKFNLDGTLSSVESPPFTSPQVIFMQKLSQTPLILQDERQRVSIQPLSDRLKFAMQLAKMDARSSLEKQKEVQKQQKKTKPSKKAKPDVKLFHPLNQHKNAAIQAVPLKPSKKPFRPLQHLHPSPEIFVPPLSPNYKLNHYSNNPPTKDACVSTADIPYPVRSPVMQPSKSPNFCNTKMSLGLIKREKLNKSVNSTWSSRTSPRSPTTERVVGLEQRHSPPKMKEFPTEPVVTSAKPKRRHFDDCDRHTIASKINAANPRSLTTEQVSRAKQPHSPVLTKTYPAEVVLTHTEKPREKPCDDNDIYDFMPKINAVNPYSCRKSRKAHRDLTNRRTELLNEKHGDANSNTTNDQISYMCSTIHQQLLDMESIENDIRKRWKGIKYDMMAQFKPEEFSSNVDDLQTPINLQGGKTDSKKPNKEIVRFVKQKPEPHSKFLSERPNVQSSAKSLSMPKSTIEAVYQNKSKFSSYLYSVHHEPVGKFNPWKVVNELSKEIVDKIVSDVCDEVSDGFDECVERVFEAEFAIPT